MLPSQQSRAGVMAISAGIATIIITGFFAQTGVQVDRPQVVHNSGTTRHLTLATIPPVASTCPTPANTFAQLPNGSGIHLGVENGEMIAATETGFALSAPHGAYIYTIMVGTVNAPATLQGKGFLSASVAPADPCRYNLQAQHGNAPSLPQVNVLHMDLPGSITITGIAGDILSYKTASHGAGTYNFVTDTFSS